MACLLLWPPHNVKYICSNQSRDYRTLHNKDAISSLKPHLNLPNLSDIQFLLRLMSCRWPQFSSRSDRAIAYSYQILFCLLEAANFCCFFFFFLPITFHAAITHSYLPFPVSVIAGYIRLPGGHPFFFSLAPDGQNHLIIYRISQNPFVIHRSNSWNHLLQIYSMHCTSMSYQQEVHFQNLFSAMASPFIHGRNNLCATSLPQQVNRLTILPSLHNTQLIPHCNLNHRPLHWGKFLLGKILPPIWGSLLSSLRSRVHFSPSSIGFIIKSWNSFQIHLASAMFVVDDLHLCTWMHIVLITTCWEDICSQ